MGTTSCKVSSVEYLLRLLNDAIRKYAHFDSVISLEKAEEYNEDIFDVTCVHYTPRVNYLVLKTLYWCAVATEHHWTGDLPSGAISGAIIFLAEKAPKAADIDVRAWPQDDRVAIYEWCIEAQNWEVIKEWYYQQLRDALHFWKAIAEQD